MEQNAQGIARSSLLGGTPRVDPKSGPSCAYRAIGWLYNWAEAHLGITTYCLGMDCHSGGGSGSHLAMGTGRGHAGVAAREDAGIERMDEVVETVVAAVVTAGDERADPRIPSSSGCVSDDCGQRRNPDRLLFWTSHALSMRPPVEISKRDRYICSPLNDKINHRQDPGQCATTDNCQIIADASKAKLNEGRSGRAACFVIPGKG